LGQLGNGDAVNQQFYKLQIPGNKTIIQVAATHEAAFAIDVEGSVYSWGNEGQSMLTTILSDK
jgi:alpha-tubulin suppressor-like RCC1 family protein